MTIVGERARLAETTARPPVPRKEAEGESMHAEMPFRSA
jgi:hypothetical protein